MRKLIRTVDKKGKYTPFWVDTVKDKGKKKRRNPVFPQLDLFLDSLTQKGGDHS